MPIGGMIQRSEFKKMIISSYDDFFLSAFYACE